MFIRSNTFRNVNEYYKLLYDNYHKRMEVTAISPIELTEDENSKLIEKLEKVTGKIISIINKVDPSIIGGLIVKVENKVYDNSIKGHLKNAKREMVGI